MSLVLAVDDPELGAGAEAILGAWGTDASPGELRGLTEEAGQRDGNRGSGCVVREQLTHASWLPIGAGWVHPPQQHSPPAAFTAPFGVLLFTGSAGEQRLGRVLWSWLNPPAGGLLERLRAVPVGATVDVGVARAWFRTLRQLNLERLLSGDPANRVALLRAWQLVVNALGGHDEPLPAVLAYEPVPLTKGEAVGRALGERPLVWCGVQEAWMASDPRTQTALARYFPNVRLATAVLSAQSMAQGPFAGRTIGYTTVVRHEVEEPRGDALAARVARRLAECLPHLLALADLSARLNRPVSSLEDLHLRRTLLLEGHLRRAGDVFLDHVLTAGPMSGRQGLPWRKGDYDDVFFEGEPGTRSATIWFDVSSEDAPPPLRNFGEALAAFMGLGEVAEAWSLALSEVEAESVDAGSARLDAFLKRKGGSVQALGRYRRLLCPHTEPELAELAAAVARGLTALGLAATRELPPGVTLLGVDDVAALAGGDVPNPGQATVRAALEAALEERHLMAGLPVVDFQTAHQAGWARWLGVERTSRRTRLLRWVQLARAEEDVEAMLAMSSPRAKRLDQAHAPSSERLRFDAESVARAWLRQEVADLARPLPSAPLDTWLPELRRYTVVTKAPVIVATNPIAMALPSGAARALAPMADGARAQEAVQTAERGEDAELALLSWVIVTTQAVLEAEPMGWDRLLAAAGESKSVHSAIERCRRTGRIDATALHVSKSWGNAGYDILGLEMVEGDMRVVRYEVKGLPKGGTRLRFFLSRNEHGVARRCRSEGTVWRLIGVREDAPSSQGGGALDLTGVVQELLEREGNLEGLGQLGIVPDGYVVYREIPG